MITPRLEERLQALKNNGTIAGWQDRGATKNFGLSKAPLPALIFPANEGHATTYYDLASMEMAVTALEEFGAMLLVGRMERTW